jgi:hypothetical protein
MLPKILGFFLIAHGLVHSILAAAPNPNDPDAKAGAFFTAASRSWLLPRLNISQTSIQWIGIGLVVLATMGFLLTGLGIFGVTGVAEVWRTLAIVSASVSLLLLILFWHSWLPVGVAINVVVLIALILLKWPSADLIGA